MTVENIEYDQSPRKNVADLGSAGGQSLTLAKGQ